MTKASRPNPGNSSLILHTETRVIYSNGIVFKGIRMLVPKTL